LVGAHRPNTHYSTQATHCAQLLHSRTVTGEGAIHIFVFFYL
jgi:hypothetical protein